MNFIGNFKFEIGNYRKGFTLVELLIVIAIIGILSTVLMVNFVGIRERARDAKRKSDMRQMQAAIELYRTDVGRYPLTNAELSSCNAPFTNGGRIYMSVLPKDPLDNSCYSYTSDGSTYSLYGCIENTNDNEKDLTVAPGSNCAASYTVKNP